MKVSFRKYQTVSWALFFVMVTYMFYILFKLPEPFMWLSKGGVLLAISTKISKRFVPEREFVLIKVYIGWILFEILIALSFVEGYWMWKNLVLQLFISLLYLVIVLSTNMKVLQDYFALYWRFFLPLAILSVLSKGTPVYLNYVPFAVLFIFFSAVPNRKRLWLMLIVIMFFITNDQRNDIVKIAFTATIGLYLTFFYFTTPKWALKLLHAILLTIPFILTYLAVTGTFNVFRMDEYIKGDHTIKVKTEEGLKEESLTTDTRTFLYENVFYTLNKYDAWTFGRSPAFGDEGVDGFWGMDKASGLVGRYGNEVGILDVLLWYGVVGVLLYFLIFFRASYMAIYKSHNKFAKGIGVYAAFIWMWSFVWEKPMFETFFLMDLLVLGLCFSVQFRQMDDEDVREWIKGIFGSSKVKVI